MAYYAPPVPYFPAPAQPQFLPPGTYTRPQGSKPFYRRTQKKKNSSGQPSQQKKKSKQPKADTSKKTELKEVKLSKSSLKPGDVRSQLSATQVSRLLNTIHESLLNGHGMIRFVAASSEDKDGTVLVTPTKTHVTLTLHGLQLRPRISTSGIAAGISRVQINEDEEEVSESA